MQPTNCMQESGFGSRKYILSLKMQAGINLVYCSEMHIKFSKGILSFQITMGLKFQFVEIFAVTGLAVLIP